MKTPNVLEIVTKHPNMTAREIVRMFGGDVSCIKRSLTQLVNDGLVKRNGKGYLAADCPSEKYNVRGVSCDMMGYKGRVTMLTTEQVDALVTHKTIEYLAAHPDTTAYKICEALRYPGLERIKTIFKDLVKDQVLTRTPGGLYHLKGPNFDTYQPPAIQVPHVDYFPTDDVL